MRKRLSIEEQKVKVLLFPRYEVIATYPEMDFKLGDILTEMSPGHFTKVIAKGTRQLIHLHIDLSHYPHLFRKMDWWEQRTLEEMPKKLKVLHITDENNNPVVCEIAEWDMRGPVGYKDKGGTIVLAGWPGYGGYLPTT